MKERLTRANIDAEPGAARHMDETHLIGDISDKLLDLILNGPTINGIAKGEIRGLLRQTYGRLKEYEDTDAAADQRRELLKRAVDTYGAEAQVKMAIEEMSELTKAICKLWRAKDGPETTAALEAIREEAADVQIMLEQLRIMFGDTAAPEAEKLDRLRGRLDRHDAEEGGAAG